MSDVFISYKREEREAVQLIGDKLRALRLDVWFDEKLRAGSSFDEEIAGELTVAKAVLVCWTPAAFGSEWVRGEAVKAHELGKLVACFLERTNLMPPFNVTHTENLIAWGGNDDDPAWLKILEAIAALVGRPGLPRFHQVMRPGAPVAELRAWAESNGADPLAELVWDRVTQLEGESAGDRIARERTEARTRDQERKAAAARAKALATARGVRDPQSAQRRMRYLTAGVIAAGVLILLFVAYQVDADRRRQALDAAQTPEAVATFLSSTPSWHPVARAARAKFDTLDNAAWQATTDQGTIAAYDAYIKRFSQEPKGRSLALAKERRAAAERVLRAQTLLQRLDIYEGSLDGALGERTRDAVNTFLFREGTVQTGTVNDELFMRLEAALTAWKDVTPDQLIAERIGPPTPDEYRAAAARLGIDGPTLMAVRKVEAGSVTGFTPDRHPLIVFESRMFSRLTKGRFDQSHPHLTSPRPITSYGHGGGWKALEEAYTLDPDAAYKATSFGVFQVTGINHQRVGFETVGEYARFMAKSEANQVEVWARFLERQGMLESLRKHDWAGFARRYNGPAALRNGYVERLEAAYNAALAEFRKGGHSTFPSLPGHQ
jgi:peptidoglycan hydrolase-like protein with peptidoglycan-binding domain